MVTPRRGGRRRALPAAGDRPAGPAAAVDGAGAARHRLVRPGARASARSRRSRAARRPPPPGERLVVRGARFSYAGGARRAARHRPGGAARRAAGHRRPVRRRQVHPGPAAGRHRRAPRGRRSRVGGVPVTDLDPAERRRRIALVTQEHHVFIGSLRDNLAFAAPDATDDADARRARRRRRRLVRATCPTASTPSSATAARQLGAAEAQQLALARLVLADPHTLILDEATAALDPTTARRTERALAAVLDRAHRHRHRAPAQHRPRRRPGGRAGGRPDHRARQPRRPGRGRRGLRRAVALLAHPRRRAREASYFTAPAVRPAWICRWKTAYTMSIGQHRHASARRTAPTSRPRSPALTRDVGDALGEHPLVLGAGRSAARAAAGTGSTGRGC